MKVLFITRRNPGAASEQIAALRPEEVRAVWHLVKTGTLREIYYAAERPAVVGVLECAGAEEARSIMAAMPMAQHGLIDFDFLVLTPYDQFELLFRGDGG